MACFLVPAIEAIVTTTIKKVIEKKEKAPVSVEVDLGKGKETVQPIPFSRKLKWLSNMLWGGSVLLAFEHLWHGEVTLYSPFLTAASNPQDLHAMLHEMATTGVSMAVLITVVWGGMVVVSNVMAKKALVKE